MFSSDIWFFHPKCLVPPSFDIVVFGNGEEFLFGYKRLQCRNITLNANFLLDNSESDIMHKLVTLWIKWNLYNSKFSSSFTSLLNATSLQIYSSILKNYSYRCGYIFCNYNISLYAFRFCKCTGVTVIFFDFLFVYYCI